VTGRDGDVLKILIGEVMLDSTYDLGNDPGLQKDGVEAHLQLLLADHPEALRPGLSLVRREHLTPIGPVDLLCRDGDGSYVAVEVKRRGEIDGVEQLTRYLELMRRDPLLGRVSGIFAAQQIRPQARVLAVDRGIACVTVDYDALRGLDKADERLF
jgi:endonuclease